MLCGFECDYFFIEYIKQEGWSKLLHVMSMSVTDVNAVHMVESNGWTFKERQVKMDLKVFKGFLLYFAWMASK